MAGNGSFDERMDYLSNEVGTGDLVMGCDVDQPYAQDQHETPYRHRIGRMKYLGGPLFENAFSLVEMIARGVITEDGSDLKSTAMDVADELESYVEKNAPVDTGRLSESGSPYVEDNGTETYRRPPLAPREKDIDDTV